MGGRGVILKVLHYQYPIIFNIYSCINVFLHKEYIRSEECMHLSCITLSIFGFTICLLVCLVYIKHQNGGINRD